MQAFETIVVRFNNLKTYLDWSSEDEECSPLLLEVLTPHLRSISDDFYQQIKKYPAALRVISGGDAQIARLRASLEEWLTQSLQALHDEAYIRSRWQVGLRHVQIGLDQLYVGAAFSRVRTHLGRQLCEADSLTIEQRVRAHVSLDKRLDLDLAMMSDAYQTEYLSRQVPVDQARLQQQKLLAQLSAQALAGLELGALYENATTCLCEAFSCDCCDFFLFDQEQRRFRLQAATGWPFSSIGVEVDGVQDAGQLSYVARQSNCVRIDDLDVQQIFEPLPLYTEQRIASCLQAPVRAEDRTFGVLSVHFRTRHAFQPSDHDFLISVANLLATAARRKSDEHRIASSVEQLRRLMDHLPAGAVHVLDAALRVNQPMERIVGRTQAEMRSLREWQAIVEEETPAEVERPAIADASIDGSIGQSLVKIRHPQKGERTLSKLSFQSAIDEVWLLQDITEERELQEQRLQSERLAAIGQMITGLAHESRNSLQRIQACTEMLELHVGEDETAQNLLVRLQQAQDDLQLLFNEVRSYAAPIVLEKSTCDLIAILNQSWSQLEPSRSGRAASLDVLHQEDALMVDVDRFRISQVFRNFFENSLAACADPVAITVRLEIEETGDEPFVGIQIRDNGPGFSVEVAERIFEPFFTTKSKGSGLGMAIASRIITAHQGSLSAIAQENEGALFEMTLPLIPSVSRESS